MANAIITAGNETFEIVPFIREGGILKSTLLEQAYNLNACAYEEDAKKLLENSGNIQVTPETDIHGKLFVFLNWVRVYKHASIELEPGSEITKERLPKDVTMIFGLLFKPRKSRDGNVLGYQTEVISMWDGIPFDKSYCLLRHC